MIIAVVSAGGVIGDANGGAIARVCEEGLGWDEGGAPACTSSDDEGINIGNAEEDEVRDSRGDRSSSQPSNSL